MSNRPKPILRFADSRWICGNYISRSVWMTATFIYWGAGSTPMEAWNNYNSYPAGELP
jgi:hypothetical protein